MRAKKPTVLAIVPARGGSKRINNKNIRSFAGKPLIVHAIKQARSLTFVDRIIVDTDSKAIAKVARSSGAEVPFLRPSHLATDNSQMVESILHLLSMMKEKEAYVPDYILLLQPTSPLREKGDVVACWKRMHEGDATTVLTVAPTHPQLYYLGKKGELELANKVGVQSTNTQAWRPGYLLNGCFVYLVYVPALLKEKKIITRKTVAVTCPKWRSVDLDTPEEWVLAEFLFKNTSKIERALKDFKNI